MESISSPKTTICICTTKCGNTAYDRMIQCGQCKRFTHFNCTLLPGYQLQQMMTKGYRKYICPQCFGKVDKIYCNNEIKGDHKETGVEPAINRYQLATMEEENGELKSENSALLEKLSMANAEITRIRNCLTETEDENIEVKASRRKLNFENGKLRREIDELETTLADTRSLLEQETELRKINDNEHRKLVTSCEAEEYPGNIQRESEPNSDKMTNFEHVMVGKIQIMSESITKSVQKEIQEYNKQIESKINLIVEKTQFGKERPQQIEPHAISNTVGDDQNRKICWRTISGRNYDMKSIMRDARNDAKLEESEKERRSKNIIIHGAKEKGNGPEDSQYVKDIFMKVGATSEPVLITRVGVRNESKSRPIKIVMKTVADKEKVMKNLGRLKETEQLFGKISVKDDYTAQEREEIRLLTEKAKQQSTGNEDRIFKVRGSSKHGWKVVSFPR